MEERKKKKRGKKKKVKMIRLDLSGMHCSVLVSSVLARYVWLNTGVLCRSGESVYQSFATLFYLEASSSPTRLLCHIFPPASFHLSLLQPYVHLTVPCCIHPTHPQYFCTFRMFLHASCGCLAALHVCAHTMLLKRTHSSSPPI